MKFDVMIEQIEVGNTKTGPLDRKPLVLNAKLENNLIHPAQIIKFFVEVKEEKKGEEGEVTTD